MDVIASYLERLRTELRVRGLRTPRIIEETRAHLDDAANALVTKGLTRDDAEREAVAQFGPARAVAARFASRHFGWESFAALAVALAAGAVISWVDNRPHWDDSGITALALVEAGGLVALAVPRRPWLWAIAVWISLPVWNIVARHTIEPAMLSWLIVLIFPMVGALAGVSIRRVLAR